MAHELVERLRTAEEFDATGVAAVLRLSTDLEWSTAAGDRLTARAGDLLCSDGHQFWTVAAEVHAARFEQTSDGRSRRSVPVRAVQVGSATDVPTLEGPVVARPGDWILWGGGLPDGRDELWVVPDGRFRQRYRRRVASSGDPVPASPHGRDRQA